MPGSEQTLVRFGVQGIYYSTPTSFLELIQTFKVPCRYVMWFLNIVGTAQLGHTPKPITLQSKQVGTRAVLFEHV